MRKQLGSVLAALALVCSVGRAQQTTKLDTTQFVVVGEGLAAGMADFALRDVYQEKSFGAQMALQMKTAFPQPLIQAPGIGNVPGYTQVPTHLPGTLQGSVRTPFPPYLFVFNVSVPSYKLADSMTRRPSPPILQQRDSQQTVINMILGYPALIVGKDKPLWTQAEYAVQMNPTMVVVELGYFDVLEPAVNDDPRQLPDVAAFRTNLTALLNKLNSTHPQMIVMTVPDPFDTPYFNSLADVTRLVGTPASSLMSIFKVKADDLITPYGLMLIGNLILSDNVDPLRNPIFPGLASFFPGTVVSSATRTAVRARVTALNTEIVNAAKAIGANVYDLAGLYSRVRAQGFQVPGGKLLTANFLGGFYSLNSFYPGAIGQGIIANDLLTLLNTTYKTSFPLVDLTKLAPDDPAGRFTPASVRKPITTGESK